MARETITLTLTNLCAAQNHGDLNLFLDGTPVGSKIIHWEEEKEIPTNQELKDALYLLAREMIKRSGANTKAEVRDTIPALKIILQYPIV